MFQTSNLIYAEFRSFQLPPTASLVVSKITWVILQKLKAITFRDVVYWRKRVSLLTYHLWGGVQESFMWEVQLSSPSGVVDSANFSWQWYVSVVTMYCQTGKLTWVSVSRVFTKVWFTSLWLTFISNHSGSWTDTNSPKPTP